ncbi:hypothetical protein GCK72_022841 [Caenorhabditis remanei]|uniref:Uncharacterized protein n=1 Tax=Caenorhabditis remanei TaxID=31234 RepID=A0A6A5FUX9_CAERE|nr:hypothetical protein GCK72_022841 [Caenorhabditis remanei]KAF1746387.1 hypothetical protein GCK72_022841 [Caenorhabditis remanei]
MDQGSENTISRWHPMNLLFNFVATEGPKPGFQMYQKHFDAIVAIMIGMMRIMNFSIIDSMDISSDFDFFEKHPPLLVHHQSHVIEEEVAKEALEFELADYELKQRVLKLILKLKLQLQLAGTEEIQAHSATSWNKLTQHARFNETTTTIPTRNKSVNAPTTSPANTANDLTWLPVPTCEQPMYATPSPGPLNPVTQRASATISAEDDKNIFHEHLYA